MSAAYRAPAPAPVETIVVAPAPRWWPIGLVVPYALTFSDAFMGFVAPIPRLEGGGFCGNGARNFGEVMAAQTYAVEVKGLLFVLALASAAFVVASALRPRTVVTVDRAARVIRVRRRSAEWAVTFGDKPVLLARDGRWMLHAGALPPIPIAPDGISRRSLAQLRAALQSIA